MDRDYDGELRQAREYINKVKYSSNGESTGWEALKADEYTPTLREFEKVVMENEGLWNTCNFGYTMEFSTSREDFEKKSQILEYSSNRLKKGRWRIMRCSTCAGYSNGEKDIHVVIDHSMDWQEQHDHNVNEYQRMNLLRKKFPFGTINVRADTLDAVLETLEFGSDLYRELSLHLDEGREAAKLIEYYH